MFKDSAGFGKMLFGQVSSECDTLRSISGLWDTL